MKHSKNITRLEWRERLLKRIEIAKDKPFIVKRHKFKNSRDTLEKLAPEIAESFK